MRSIMQYAVDTGENRLISIFLFISFIIPTATSNTPTMIFNKNLGLFLVFLSGVSAGSLRASEESGLGEHMSLFEAWSMTYAKVYTTEQETAERMKVWINNHSKLPCCCRLTLYPGDKEVSV